MQNDWTKISGNPVSKEVHDFLEWYLKARRTENVLDLMSFAKGFVEGKDVLDIGVVEHDISHLSSKDWKHAKFKEWSRSILGVDILKNEVEVLKSMGFNVVVADATSGIDLGQRFDRVIIGDVIEHVNNPVDLLKFAKRHLRERGEVLVSTPNPFWWHHILRVLKDGVFIANAEHITWITPSNAVELARRSGLELKEYKLTGLEPKSPIKRLLKKMIGKNGELFSAIYLYVFECGK